MVEGLGLHRRGCVDERGGDRWADPGVGHERGVAEEASFRTAVDILDRLDPHRIRCTKFLDRLMPRSADLIGDIVVDGADLGAMLASWSSYP